MEYSREDKPASPHADSKQSANPPLREEPSTVHPPSSSSAPINGRAQAYTDYSHLTLEDMKDIHSISSPSFLPPGGGTGQESSDSGRNSNNQKEPPFVAKLHSILSNSAFDDIVSWLPHGRAWRVDQRAAFEEQVLPLYFRHGKYSSFMRQVNGWGFQRINQGPDYGGYYHEVSVQITTTESCHALFVRSDIYSLMIFIPSSHLPRLRKTSFRFESALSYHPQRPNHIWSTCMVCSSSFEVCRIWLQIFDDRSSHYHLHHNR